MLFRLLQSHLAHFDITMNGILFKSAFVGVAHLIL